MPRFSRLGVIAEGRSDWFDDLRTVFQDCSSGVCDVRLSDGTVVLSHAANKVTGGGGVAAIWEQHPEGVIDSLGRTFAGAWTDFGCSSPEGGYALKLSYHSHGPWDVIERDGSRWRLTDGDVRSLHLLGGGRAVLTDAGDWIHGIGGIGVPQRRGWFVRGLDAHGRVRVLYQDVATSALVFDGRVIAGPGNYFYPDVRTIDDHVFVVYSPFQSDTSPQVLSFTFADLDRMPRIEDLDVPHPIPDPDPIPEPEPEPQPMSWNTAPEATARKVAELVIVKHPAAWQAAHAPGSHSRAYMDLVAGYLHFGWPEHGIPADPKWGCNGKRGTDEKSEDILNYQNPAVPKLGLESYDFFRASMPEAGIVWNNITDPDGAGAKFIVPPKPAASGEPDPIPNPKPEPVPSDLQKRLAAIEKDIAELKAKPSGGIKSGDKIALQCEDGTFIWAVGGGSDDVRAKHPHDKPGSDPGGHETFTVVER